MGRTPRVPAELTHRPFTLDEARAAGITLSALRGRSWRRLGSRLYTFAEAPEDALQLLNAWHGRLPDAIFTGLTAAWLHRLDVDPCHPIEAALPSSSAVRSQPGLFVRHRAIRQSDVEVVRGLPATAPRLTMCDLRKRFSKVEFLVLADEALRRGLGRFDLLAEAAESPMETRLRWLLLEAGLPTPEVQSDLYDSHGNVIGRADLYYPTVHLVIEFDGGNHRDRLINDDRRQNAILSAGYRILRFTSADLYGKPDSIVRLVRGYLSGR